MSFIDQIKFDDFTLPMFDNLILIYRLLNIEGIFNDQIYSLDFRLDDEWLIC